MTSFFQYQGFPDVPLDTESSKEIKSEKNCPSIHQEAESVLSSTRRFPEIPIDTDSSMELYSATDKAKETNHPFMITEKVTEC